MLLSLTTCAKIALAACTVGNVRAHAVRGAKACGRVEIKTAVGTDFRMEQADMAITQPSSNQDKTLYSFNLECGTSVWVAALHEETFDVPPDAWGTYGRQKRLSRPDGCRITGKDDSDGIAHLEFIPDKTNSSDIFQVHEGEGDKQVRFPFCHRVSDEQVLFIPIKIASGLEIADTRSRGDSKNLHWHSGTTHLLSIFVNYRIKFDVREKATTSQPASPILSCSTHPDFQASTKSKFNIVKDGSKVTFTDEAGGVVRCVPWTEPSTVSSL